MHELASPFTSSQNREARPFAQRRHRSQHRIFVDGVLWVLRSGVRWSDLPERYGKWKSVHKRFTRWAKAGVSVAGEYGIL
jgi:transposase